MALDSGDKRLQLSKHLDYVIQFGFKGKQRTDKRERKTQLREGFG